MVRVIILTTRFDPVGVSLITINSRKDAEIIQLSLDISPIGSFNRVEATQMDLTDTPDIREPGEEPPDFDDWEEPESLFSDQPIRDRMLDVSLQLREPTTVAEIAERVDCDTETAREYLKWFAEMGLVREHEGRPVRYERSQSYLRWRRIEQIRADYSEDEIVLELQRTLDAVAEYRERFDANDPDAISLLDAESGMDAETTWEALSAWKTAKKRAELLDAARRVNPAEEGRTGRIDA